MPLRRPALRDWSFYHHEHTDTFVKPIWPSCSPTLYLIYRVVIALYFLTWLILSWWSSFIVKKTMTGGAGDWNSLWRFYIYVTCWTYTIFTAYLVLAACNCLLHYCSAHRRSHSTKSALPRAPPPTSAVNISTFPYNTTTVAGAAPTGADADVYKSPPSTASNVVVVQKIRVKHRYALQWLLFNIAVCCEPIIMILFWCVLYPRMAPFTSAFDLISTIHLHGLCALCMIIDLLLVRIPVRWPHMSHCIAYAAFYFIFNLVYVCVLNATDAAGNHFIYPILDWRQHLLGAVILGLIVLVVGIPLGWSIAWCLFKLREKLAGSVVPQTPLPPDTIVTTIEKSPVDYYTRTAPLPPHQSTNNVTAAHYTLNDSGIGGVSGGTAVWPPRRPSENVVAGSFYPSTENVMEQQEGVQQYTTFSQQQQQQQTQERYIA